MMFGCDFKTDMLSNCCQFTFCILKKETSSVQHVKNLKVITPGTLQFTWKSISSRIAYTMLEDKVRGPIVLTCKTYYKATVIQRV